MSALCVSVALLVRIFIARCSILENIQLTNFGTATTMFFATEVSNVANDHSVSHLEIRMVSNEWFSCTDYSYAFKCAVDSEIALPLSVRLTANGETVVSYNVITDFEDGSVFDFGENFANANIAITTAGSASQFHYAATVTGIEAGYKLAKFEISEANGNFIECEDKTYEIVCNVDVPLVPPMTVRLTAHNTYTITAFYLIESFEDGVTYDFGENFPVGLGGTTSSTTTTTLTALVDSDDSDSDDSDSDDDGSGGEDALIVILVLVIIGVVGVAVFYYVKKQKTERGKGYTSDQLELQEDNGLDDAKKVEMMQETITQPPLDDDDEEHQPEEHEKTPMADQTVADDDEENTPIAEP